MAEAILHDQRTTANASLIVAMHAQFERVYAAHGVNDKMIRSKDDTERHQRDQAMIALYREQEHLSMAILHQVPRSHLDATIMLFHIQKNAESLAREDLDKEERATIALATETVFEFMASAVDEDVGALFLHDERFNRTAREYRTEQPTEDARG